MSYFFRYVWYRQSAADTSLAFRATRFRWWMNGEAFTILNPRSFLTEFFGITAAKTLKNPYHLQTVTIKLLKKGKKTTERKTESYSNSVALVMAFLEAENENRQLKDFPQADFDRIPERFLLSVGTNSITDSFVYWKLRP